MFGPKHLDSTAIFDGWQAILALSSPAAKTELVHVSNRPRCFGKEIVLALLINCVSWAREADYCRQLDFSRPY
jgi:hypothetical protein